MKSASKHITYPSTWSYPMKIKTNIRAGKKGSDINNTVIQIATYISRCVGA
jgi:hypothetical protein